MEITTLARQMAGVLLDELALRPGADLVARVAVAPANGGRGVISLAGVLLSAQLPAGLAAGQRLPVRVVRAGGDEVLLKLRSEAAPAEATQAGRPIAQAAGSLAVSGDGQLVRVADGLTQPGLALPLPNGDALTLQVADDAQELAVTGHGKRARGLRDGTARLGRLGRRGLGPQLEQHLVAA